MAKRYKPLRKDQVPMGQRPLPLDKPVAVYSRVSTTAQIGNESSRIQKDGMKQRLQNWGYAEDKIIIIDMDEGISGQKGPDQRPGIKQVIQLIEAGSIGAVATEHASRFFRDQTMIAANTFIDLCRKRDVRLIVGDKLYDVNHPVSGLDDIRTLRKLLEDAATYLHEQIYKTLLPARHAVGMRGEYDGRGILPGFLVDMRTKLPDGSDNPNYRKYVLYEPEARVIREWFRLARKYKGNVSATWRHIRQHGPYLPDRRTAQIPMGFITNAFQYKSDPVTGHIVNSRTSLENLLTNITYYGGWRYSDRVVILDNHEPLVDRELFMAVFNMLSPVDFFGEPNPHYQPQRTWTRHDRTKRDCPRPVYYGLIYSDDVPEKPHKYVVSGYFVTTRAYHYTLTKSSMDGTLWCIKCQQADDQIDALLKERLRMTCLDTSAFAAALASVERGDNQEVERLKQDIAAEEAMKQRLELHLTTLSNVDLIRKAETQYEAACVRLMAFQQRLAEAQAQENQSADLETAPQVLKAVMDHWADTDPEDRRSLMLELAKYIEITRTGHLSKRIIIHWKDGSQSVADVRNRGRGKAWPEEDLQRLKAMIEANVDQVVLLRAFPELAWRNILDLYSWHFNNRKRPAYTGLKPYPQHTRWEDTDEYRAEQAAESQPSSTRPMRDETRPTFYPLDWLELAQPQVLRRLRALAEPR